MLLLQTPVPPSNPLNDATWLFPALECWHILGFALSIGTIAIVDFRLLGFGMMRQSAQDLAKDLAPWTLFGLASMLISGPIMFATDPDMYYLSRAFQVKMAALLLAILVHYTVRRKAVASGASSAKTLACVSLLLWAVVLGGGIFIGFQA
jgi:hypothetical protein